MVRILAAVAVVLACNIAQGQNAPVPPKEAAARMKLPEGFHATLFAGEPDVVQPIAFTFDDRGRLWVAECRSYPKWIKDGSEGSDRILIFEDTDGDGRFDKRTVFHSKLANVSGIEYGFGGIWVIATPNLLFIPDRDGDDVPDGPPQVVLDGWSLAAQHNVPSSLRWGPDGWLYGCNGILATSQVGPPGAKPADRVALNCGVWRYHPTRKKFELFASGTTNPWGLDFDDYGEMFITNCVIEHIWHVVPGAHFQRMFGQDLNPHVYSLMPSIADHIHWGGGHWTSSRGGQGAHSDAGGGHAHSGCMIYLGDNWPERYRNGAFMCNIHGNRINNDLLERVGSTYRARHGMDFMFANDPWFRGLALGYGPDGAVFVLDWSDTGECHNYQVVDKSNGRIYKITYGEVKQKAVDLAKLSDAELVELQLHRNDWYVRHARRLLQERQASGKFITRKLDLELSKRLQGQTDTLRRLRLLWALWAIQADEEFDHAILMDVLKANSEYERAWGIRLTLAVPPSMAIGEQITLMGETDPSAHVRLHIAAALPRMSDYTQEFRWRLLERLLDHEEDAQDLYLPLMLWYAAEPLVSADPRRGAKLLAGCKIPRVREYIVRRLLNLPDASRWLDEIMQVVAAHDEPFLHRDVLRGVQEGLSGRRNVPIPKSWQEAFPILRASPLGEVRDKSVALALQFGDERAVGQLRQVVRDAKASPAARQNALASLLFTQRPDLLPLLHELLADRDLRAAAIRGLAAFPSADTPALLLKSYPDWSPEEKADALQTLASRPAFALALLDAVRAKSIPRTDVSAFTIRQMRAMNDATVSSKLEEVWGAVRPASEVKTALLGKYRSSLNPDSLKKADLIHGRQLYAKHCAACHKLFGEGGDVGPELTGSQRGNLDYVLENVLDPSAIVPNDYKVWVLETKNGRVLTGIIKGETDRAVTVQTQNEKLVLPRDEIESRTASKLSIMPEGLLDPLRSEEVRDLVGYLQSPVQVPLPKEAHR